jgi:hypothetical protein
MVMPVHVRASIPTTIEPYQWVGQPFNDKDGVQIGTIIRAWNLRNGYTMIEARIDDEEVSKRLLGDMWMDLRRCRN